MLLSNSHSVNFRYSRGSNSCTCKYHSCTFELRSIATCVHMVILQAIAFLPSVISLTTTCLLTLERYISIMHPILHRSRLTKGRILACASCLVVWVTAAGPHVRFITWEELHTAVNVVTVFFFLAFNTFAYTRIYLAVKKMHF